MLRKSIELLNEGNIFIGDIRDYRFLDEFHLSVELFNMITSKQNTDVKGLQQRITRNKRNEAELLVAPEYFMALYKDYSKIQYIEILPKRGNRKHEMNLFRYDVIIHVGKRSVDKMNYKLNLSENNSYNIKAQLEEQVDLIAISYYPNKRIWAYSKLYSLLCKNMSEIDVLSYYQEFEKENKKYYSVEQLYDLASKSNYNLIVSYSLNDKTGFCLIFYKKDSSFSNAAYWNDYINNPVQAKYANNPAQNINKTQINHEQLSEFLAQSVPDYMMPSSFIQMDEFPLNTVGKIDREALPDPAYDSLKYSCCPPQNETERIACKIWENIFGVELVGVSDDFFRIGGNSILAIKISNRMSNELKINISVADIFSKRTIKKMLSPQKTVLLKSLSEIDLSCKYIFAIHPASLGCEAYQPLADSLKGVYNIIGMDNYNFIFEDKIGDLEELSR